MRRTGRFKRHSKFFEGLRQKRARRTRRVQRGGNTSGLLQNADAPDVVPIGNFDFHVRFQPTVKATEQGPKFTTYQTAHEPYPVWTAPTPPTRYAIICWDPDVPQAKSFLHWLVVNCGGTDPGDGKVIASWHPPSPPPGSGEHRYIVGLFKQNAEIMIPEITDRTNFNAKTFAERNGLVAIAYRGFRVDTPPIFVPTPALPAPPAPAPPPPPPPPAPAAPAAIPAPSTAAPPPAPPAPPKAPDPQTPA
jgi:phosphatidylethanolamine-binding protein (PEBP) family uncharacterized protein